MKKAHNFVDLTGVRFGRLSVLARADNQCRHLVRWLCRCDCGKERPVLAMHLKAGSVVSCGCWAADKARGRATHGLSKSRTYVAWRSMLNRCERRADKRYADYGGRGITVCPEWHSFIPFLRDMGECPDNLTLERDNTNGNYNPGNCRWATKLEQANNKRSNVRYDYQGQSVTLTQLSRLCGVEYGRLAYRLRQAGWSFDKAISP